MDLSCSFRFGGNYKYCRFCCQMQDIIINEVGEEFGISYKEAKEMYDQYWMQYVANKIRSLEFENIYVQGLGMFSAKRANFAALVKRAEQSGECGPDNPWYQKAIKMLEHIDKSNSRRKNKKNYG